MPQASDALRAKMLEYFGPDGLDIGPAADHIAQSLSIRDKGGHFIIKEGTPVTAKDLNCLNFLAEEWDYSWEWEGIV